MTCSQLAIGVARQLAERKQRLVLAESCTGGLISATLAEIPGISSHFCGSSVVYREQSKQQWLGVPAELLERWTAVSAQATAAIARGVLERTWDATLALGITGHLGPEAPADQDGRIFLGVWARRQGDIHELDNLTLTLDSVQRIDRLREACDRALELLMDCLQAG